jgi:hypothetical protein
MNRLTRDRLVGGFGAAGIGWIGLVIVMYFIAYPTQHSILQFVYLMGALGATLLFVAIAISLKYREISN